MAFSDPIVGADNALIRDAIQSQGFVSGVSGWRIEKDGDAEFADVAIRGVVHVPGTVAPAEVVIDTLGSGLPYVGFVGANSEMWTLSGDSPTVQDAQFILRGPTDTPSIALVENQGIFFSSGDNSSSVGFMMEGVDGTQAVDAPGFIKRYGPSGYTDVESWHTLTYSNGWHNNGGPYEVGRYYLEPSGFVNLEGLIIPGTTANGTTIFSLPAGYRPPKDHLFLCNTGGGSSVVGLAINSAGTGSCFGAGAGGMSLSGVRFSVAQLG